MEKQCPKCLIIKDVSRFEKHRKHCTDCRAVYKKQYYIKHRKKVNLSTKKYSIENAGKIKVYNKAQNDKIKEYRRGFNLKKKYGINIDQYETMLKNQDYRCAICKAPQSQYTKRFAVDHSHISNKIRGLLCVICNHYICGFIDKRAKSKFVGMTELEFVENLAKYYRKSS